MRILQIINSLGTGGAEKLLLDTIPLYRERNIEMDILLLWDNNFQFTQRLKERDCCKIHILTRSANQKDIYSLSHIFKIRNLIKEYDIVHVHLFPAQYFVAIANIGINKKIIFTEHSTSNRRISNKRFKYIEQWCYGRYDKLIYISEGTAKIYNKYLKLNNKSIVIPNGVDLQEVQSATPTDKAAIHPLVEQTDTLLMQVSGFRPEKDQDTLIKALKFLPHQYKLILVGDGERRTTLEKLVQHLDLKRRVVFLGTRSDVYNLMKAVSISILSSHWEGFGLVAVEGMASGKPFIASDVPGLRDIVKGAGLLFKQGNAEELANIIKQLTEDDELRLKTAENCIKRANEYDIAVMINKYIQLYRSICDKD